MIDFIKENKSLTAVFEEVETMHSAKKAEIQRRKSVIEEVSVPKPPAVKPFYASMCEDFVQRLKSNDMAYDEGLVRINISFKDDNPGYKISFPLIETGETSVKQFVSCLKQSIKKYVGKKFSVNLSMKETEDTYNVIVVLDENIAQVRNERSFELEKEA